MTHTSHLASRPQSAIDPALGPISRSLQVVDPDARARAIARARERRVVIPTLREQVRPELVSTQVRDGLRRVGLWDVHPLNLFRVTWHNEPTRSGGGFGAVNHLEFPPALTGVPARIIGLVGKWFPTGAHKVGAAFGCLVPALVSGSFDPTQREAVWPSTGNYCRGGAYDAALVGCKSVAVLPEGMSRERFEWLAHIAGRVIRTPGSESNVKEIFDACWALRRSGDPVTIFNQFEDFGNYLWHYTVTGAAMHDLLRPLTAAGATYRGLVLTTGSAGTLAAGDYLKTHFPASKIVACEALQCPTMLENGHGEHRIEGIGDKHVPWIHNVRNTDMVIAIDDAAVLDVVRLFNEPAGGPLLQEHCAADVVDALPLLGISGAANLLACIKFAKWYGLGPTDVVLTVLTDSIELYRSRLSELRACDGEFDRVRAAETFQHHLMGASTDHMEELAESGRRRIHNLKYFTWVEQQGKTVEELDAQWDDAGYWRGVPAAQQGTDELIDAFNAESGVGRAT